MKIGIFGGTFNPVHNGHINMIKNIKEKTDLDVVYFVPSFQTPDKFFQIEKISPKDRYLMVKKTIKSLDLKWLKVSDFEYKQKGTSFTYKTINYFRNKFPKDDLIWIMGEDRYKGFEKWENYEYIISNAEVIVYRRFLKLNKDLINNKEIMYMKDIFFDISSSEILQKGLWNNIPLEAKKYICKNKLYLKTVIFHMLKSSRYEHSVAVASHSRRLAKEYKYKDSNKAWLTGLVHDMFKLHTDQELINYKINKGKEFSDKYIPIPALHGFIVALWIRDEYGWDDIEVFNALSSHTLSKGNAKKLDKIIFVADKISTDRKGHKIGKTRKLAYKSLDQTYAKILKQTVKNLEKKGIDIHEDTIEAYREHINERYLKPKYEFNLKINKRKS